MNKILRRWGALLLAVLMIIAVCLLFATRKTGMFIDEIYTFGLSNSHNAPFLKDVMGGTMTDKVISRSQLMDYMVVNEGEGFDFKSVYTNQVADVHPPLYYWLLNIACSFAPGEFSMWPGLILDCIIYVAALLILYSLLMKLYEKPAVAVAGVVMYGLSLLGLNTMLMIRMYVLLTMLTLLLCRIVVGIMQEAKPIHYVLLPITLMLGLLTQYYYVFYAFFLCGLFVFWLVYKKDWKGIGKFAASAFIGVGLFILIFPAVFDHLFADKLVSGGNAIENLKDSSQYLYRIMYYVSELRHGLKAAIICALVVLLLCGVFFKGIISAAREKNIRWEALLFIIPAGVTLVLVALISPVLDQRYVYNIVPVFVLAACFVLHLLDKSMSPFKKKELILWAVTCCITVVCLFYARLLPPQYLYNHYVPYDQMLSEHSDDPCIYMTDEHFEPMTQDLMQLAIFEDVFVTGDAESPALDEYLSQKGYSDECVVFIDIDAFWSSGFKVEEMLPALIESTEYTDYELLYENGLSVSYLLSKAD